MDYNFLDDLRERYKNADPVFQFTEDIKYQLIIDNIDSGTMLDVGCGVGMLEERLLLQRKDVFAWGVDISKTNIGKANASKCQSYKNWVTYYVGDWLDPRMCRLSRGRFDTIVCTEVLEHLDFDDQIRMIDNSKISLKAGGKFIVTVPNILYLFNFIPYKLFTARFTFMDFLESFLFGCVDQRHPIYKPHYYYMPYHILDILRLRGFKIEKVLSGNKWHNRSILGILPKLQAKIAKKVSGNLWPFNYLGMQLVVICRKI